MLPSLVAEELRDALTQFLGTTFALTDDDVRAELERFLADETHGVFRGPYVRVRLPFRPAPAGWRDVLDFLPAGLTPYRHQALAWQRLSSRDQVPLPTLITTGTGSGKTESFLVPLLDHCRRHAAVPGIKALVLYPMNALANDQARRIGAMVHDHPAELAGLRVGLYTGDAGAASGGEDVTGSGLVHDRHELRRHPPDILLTNYKMLDMLLLRSEDNELFRSAAASLRYLVLDEFHTYDGAQGTDVAMLLRRLGMAVGTHGVHGPLTGITPVATSATLGSGVGSSFTLREFAETVFGTPFESDSLIVEDRLSAAEWAAPTEGSVPLLDEVTAAIADATSHEGVVDAAAQVFLRRAAGDQDALGAALRAHPLTARIVELSRDARPLPTLAELVEPAWASRPEEARDAVSAFLALLSVARERGRPLLAVDVQLWLREVRRVTRRLDVAPKFHWHDGATPEDGLGLAALYCRHCGRSGWGAAARPAGGYGITPDTVWRDALTDKRHQRAWIFAPGEGATGDTRVWWADRDTGELTRTPTAERTVWVPVLLTPDDDAAAAQQCPSCGLADGIRFLGSSVATLASAALGQLFASPDIPTAEKKTLVFTDSVQDASHRAAFIESRAYTLNRRSLLFRAIGAGCTLAEIGAAVAAAPATAAERYAVLPPDLKEHESFKPYWGDHRPRAAVADRVAKLMSFAATLEFGLSARLGRSLEVTAATTARVQVPDLSAVVAAALEAVDRAAVNRVLDAEGLAVRAALAATSVGGEVGWARGVLERIRLQGGISHPWLTKFIFSGGDRYSIWGGRPRREGMPAFPSGRPAPRFPTTVRASDAFDTISGARGWYAQWTARALGIPAVDAPKYVRALLDALTAAGVLVATSLADKSLVWALPPDAVRLAPSDAHRSPALRCTVCSTSVPGHPEVLTELTGTPCFRTGCPGVHEAAELDADYYRDLYRAGRVRRIVAHEHTSLLQPALRVDLERRFKQAELGASDPNVLTCTPTLELGIDIGDLSMVALTSLPRSTASYLQRVGRAGRLTGNALVLSMLPARPLELQRLVDPLTMIAGEVVPPACYLDATEILRRQYLASLVDRQARTESQRPLRRAVDVFAGGLTPTSWLGRLLDDAVANAETYVADFLRGFGDRVGKETAQDLTAWAGVGVSGEVPGLERAVEQACLNWQDDLAELEFRRTALDAEAELLGAAPSRDEAQERDLRRLRGELAAVRRSLSELRTQYWISVLESLGLLPNYSLLDDSTKLDVGLWWTDEETGAAERSDDTYVRGSRTALSELAPGATFYVRGTSVEIDGLDLGSSRNPTTELRRFCPSCGWSDIASVVVTACPRCGDPAAADTGQVLRALPFRKASAYASRELAQRDDDSDDRRRTRFTVVPTVDADPGHVTAAWRLADYEFGVEVLRRVDIRWVNLGPAGRRGATVRLAGEEEPAQRFEACTGCGVVWTAQRGVHSPAEARHRGWCPQRRTPRPDGWATVVLMHHLRTQAVRLLVPPVVIVDPTLLVSFRAALLLGLREVLGGDPDHLDILVAVDPAPGSVERWAMVVHDTVPGGTGYLARFAEPEQVQALLKAAGDRLTTCACQDEGVAACHRCLLPYVAPHEAQLARRDRALELLTDVLGDWHPEPIDSLKKIVVGPHDTPVERRFRQLMMRWAKTQGASVTTHATTWGDRAEIRLPQACGGMRWRLTPQVNHTFVVPDFDLTTDDPEVPTVAVFCDGVRYHASAEHNRVADDAVKRHELREQGLLVWAVTHDDLDTFERVLDGDSAGQPGWATLAVAEAVLTRGTQLCQAGDVEAGALLADPLSVLAAFLLRPMPARWEPAARSVAFALAGAARSRIVVTSPEALPVLVRADITGVPIDVPVGQSQLLVSRSARGAIVGLDLRSLTDVRVVLGVDDRDGVVGSPPHLDAWRDWLAMPVVLQFLTQHRMLASSLDQLPYEVTSAPARPLSPAWRELASTFESGVADLLTRLAATGAPLPEAGREVADGEHQIDLAWIEHHLAVVLGHDPDRDDWLMSHDWTVLPPDEEQIRAALGLPEVRTA